ncbi:FecR family protein [Lutibacter sp.]
MKENKVHNDSEYFLAAWSEGEISAEELKKHVSEEDFNAYMELEKGIRLYEKLEAPLDHSFKKIQEKIKHKSRVRVRKLYVGWFTSIAASIVLFVGLYSLLGNNTVLLNANIGEHKNVALLDGSEVILNSKSEISYNKRTWKKEREVTLKGEAYFKVQKGSTFTVKTINGSVTVLGTQFNVISRDDFFEVVCYEGKVSVKNELSSIILLPGNLVRVLNGKIIEDHQIKQQSPSWILGESTFKSIPLKYVINALENQYNVRFDRSLIDESVIYTGSFNNKNLEIALATVFKPTNIKYRMTTANIILLENN